MIVSLEDGSSPDFVVRLLILCSGLLIYSRTRHGAKPLNQQALVNAMAARGTSVVCALVVDSFRAAGWTS